MPKFIADPALFATLSEPFESPDDANAAFEAFMKGVLKLRVKHRIRDVAVVMSGSWRTASGPQDCITAGFHGAQGREVQVLAWALGRAQRQANERVAELVAAAAAGGSE